MTTKGTLLLVALAVALSIAAYFLTRGPGYEVYTRGCCFIPRAQGCLSDVHRLACEEFEGVLHQGRCNPTTRRCE